MDTQEEYCPICARFITASNIDEVLSGAHKGYIFVHDDKPHSDESIEALEHGIQ